MTISPVGAGRPALYFPLEPVAHIALLVGPATPGGVRLRVRDGLVDAARPELCVEFDVQAGDEILVNGVFGRGGLGARFACARP